MPFERLRFSPVPVLAMAVLAAGACHRSTPPHDAGAGASAPAAGDGGLPSDDGGGGARPPSDGGTTDVGDGGLADAGDLAPAKPSDFINALHAALCQRAMDCGKLSDMGLCEELLGSGDRTVVGRREALEDALLNGRQTYDRRMAQECLDALAGRPCGSESVHDLDAYPACAVAFTGTVGTGGICEAWGDCAPGLGCAMQAQCSGDCQPIPPTNVCLRASDCPVNHLCRNNTCVARVAPGSTSGSPCGDYGLCGDGLTCVDAKCVPLSGAGQPCKSDDACTLGHRCEGGVCERVRQAGDVCGATVETVLCGEEFDRLACDYSTNHCVVLPSSGHCISPAECDPTAAYCDESTWECEPLKAPGDSCDLDGQCAGAPRSTAVCDGALEGSGVCKVVPDPICGF